MPPAEKSPKSWDYEALGAKEKGPCRALVWRWPWEEVRRGDSKRSAGWWSCFTYVRTQTSLDGTDGEIPWYPWRGLLHSPLLRMTLEPRFQK